MKILTFSTLFPNTEKPGHGIFAMDTDGRMYAESHKVGLFHTRASSRAGTWPMSGSD